MRTRSLVPAPGRRRTDVRADFRRAITDSPCAGVTVLVPRDSGSAGAVAMTAACSRVER